MLGNKFILLLIDIHRTMITRCLIYLFWCTTLVLSTKESLTPKIIIIGAGAAGVGCASRLFENAFTDVTVLEAENRIGGRLHGLKIGEYMVDMGGQWVHGEVDNVSFELAWPLGLIERMNEHHNLTCQLFGSSGVPLSTLLSTQLCADTKNLYDSLTENMTDIDSLKTGTFGEYADIRINEYFKNNPNISVELQEPLRRMIELFDMSLEAADNWYEISAKEKRDYNDCEGDQAINWKDQTYSTILDVLMKKIPVPELELPVRNNTLTNTKVTKIDFTEGSDTVRISTANGLEFVADHVIFTPSLGVLKANYEHLFVPSLPTEKINFIKNVGFGHVAKVWLYYDNPWWLKDENQYHFRNVYWTEADRKELESDVNKRWMLGILGLFPTEHKPNLLCMWLSTNHSIEMESIPEDLFRNQTLEFINRFFGHAYNVTEPTEIKRTLWNTNENFLGTYSYYGITADISNATHADLAKPIMRNNKPILQFAGEAAAIHSGTVNGAIESGWHEADRLINFYQK